MSDVTTLIYHPDEKMAEFSKRILEATTTHHVTEIQAAVVDGSLVITLHVGVIQATQEDVDEEKDANDGQCDFKVDDFIPENEPLTCKCVAIRAPTPKSAAKCEEYLDNIYATANGMVEDHKIVTGRGLAVTTHPEDLEKPPEAQRKVYVEKEVAYAVVVFLAEALEPEEDDGKDIENKLRRPRSAESILADK